MTLLVSNSLFPVCSSLLPTHLHHSTSFPANYMRPGANPGTSRLLLKSQGLGTDGDFNLFHKETHLLRSRLRQPCLETERTFCE